MASSSRRASFVRSPCTACSSGTGSPAARSESAFAGRRAFAAHAWVERDGAILGDTAARTAAFSELVDVRFYGTTTPTRRLDTP